MKQFYKYILTIVAILMTTTPAWAGKAKVHAKSDPSEGGFVYVATSTGNYSPSNNSHNAEQSGSFWGKQNKTFYLYYKEASNYHFKGWYETDANILGQWDNCNVNSSSSINQGQSITHEADGGATTADYYYYAIFATVQATQTPSFSTIAMGNTTTGTLSIKHAHANSVKIEITGEHASDFKINNTTSHSFSSTALGTQNITITFKPTCAGERKANLKITNENGLPELNITIQANATILPQTIAWNDVYNQNMFVGSTLNVSATASTGHAVTYESSNPNVISVSGNTLTAKAIGEAVITATQYDGCTYQTVSTSLTFTVSNKKTPTFWLNGDPNQLTDNLKTEDTRTITITNVDERLTADYDPNLLSYTFNGSTATIKALDAGTATLTLTQPETSQIFFGERTFTFNITKYDTNTLTNDLATAYMVDDIIPEADIYTINNDEVPIQIISSNESILKFENGQLKAVGAGTTTLTVKQSATNKWVERSATKTVTVHKFDINPNINPNTAYWNELVANPFTATTTHKFNGATHSITDFSVVQQNNKHIALMDANTRNIQTYYTNGTVDFHITRPEDRKYNALNQTLTLTVNQSNETCYLLEPCSGDFECSLLGAQRDFTPTAFTGTPDTLFFEAKSNNSARVGNVIVQQKVNGAWQDIAEINPGTSYSTYKYSLNTAATQIRFYNGYGSYKREFENVRVTRAKELTPSESPVKLSVTSIGTPETKTFTLKWSTCADEILLTNSNQHFSINTHNISTTAGQGNTTITVTCDASVVDTLRDTIVIYDQTQRIFVPVECVVNNKFIANIKGTTAYSKKVDNTWVADFRFDTCQTTLPSADINAPLYYTIYHDLTGNNVQQPGFKNQVISYNPENFTITAHNAGTAVLTFIQQPTASHYTDTLRCTITISKHDVERIWNDPVYFNDTIDNYFTTSNTASAIVIESQADTDVAKLTNEFNPTSNNSLDLITFNKEASTTVTVSQAETYYWNAYSEPHTITPIDPNNHVTFTLTQDNYINVFQKAYGDPWAGSNGPNWSNGGIRFGDNGITSGDGGWNWNDKYIIIEFTGIPDTLTFTTTTDGSATTGEITDGLFFYVAEKSPTQSEFTEIWNSTKQSNNVALKLNPDTRFIKLCYTGNLRGWFKNVKVTELNQFEARPDVLDFGLQYVDNPPAIKTFDFHYANAGYKVQLLSTDSLHFTVSPTYIDTIGGEKYGTIKDIQVTYHPTEVHNTVDTDAKILIWDEAGHRDTVFLHVNTVKSKPSLYWTEDWSAHEPIVLLGQHMPDTVAKATNGYPVKYRSDDESILKIAPDSLSFIAVGIGETYITAHADSDRVYLQPDTIRKLFRVTDKLMQYIVWEDNLTHFCIGDQPDTLHAQAWVMTDAATGEWEYCPEQTAKIQYYSSNPDVVEVQGNLLIIKGEGELLLSATINGDAIYEKTSAQVPVRVRDCSVTCSDADLVIPVINANGTVMMPEDKLEYDPYALFQNEHILRIDTAQGIPGQLIFTYRGIKAWGTLEGKIRVWESTDGGENWQQVLSDADAVEPENGVTHYSPLIPLSRNATHLKFERFPASDVKLGYHILQHITVLPDKYIESVPNDIHWGNVYVGNSPDTTIAITYSSIRSNLQIASSQPSHLTINKSTIVDDCGAWDTVPLTISLKADISIVGNYHQYVTVTDPIGGMTDTIHVYANIVKNSPTITWNPTDTIRSSAEWETQKTAISSSGDLVLYELTAGNLPEEYAYLNDAGKMILLRGGWITARAYTVETNISNEVSEYRQFFILVDPLFENTDNDQDWLNDNNWNIGRTPWLTDSATIQAGKTVILSTHVTTQGLEFQANSSIQITSTGGLTVGAQGITGAATDGSSLIIDNLKTGAGFLRISPKYTGAMPKVTMRYQTCSTLDTGANKDATWQYMGAPGANCQFTVDYITWLYQWSEPQNWINKTGTLTLEPFAGYAITQYGKPTYELIAEPINKDQTIVLTKTPENLGGMEGNNLFANSYMAPIDVKNFTGDEFTGNVEKTFYIFNSGSWNDWNQHHSNENSIGGNGSTTPGQYCAIPALSAPYLDSEYDITTIPPMQGVYVIANEDSATIRLNYDTLVWKAGNNTYTNMNEAMRAPHRQQAEQQMQQNDFLRLRIQVNSANSGADRMYIIQDSKTTSDYDNGYDAPNQFAEGMANIYTTESFGKMEVSCSNNIDSMYIGFQAGNDNQYTLTFSSIIGDSIYLKDLSNDTIFQVFEDGQYQFTAQPLSTNDLRFQVLLHPINEEDTNNGNGGVSTDIDNVTGAHIWHSHNYLYISNAPANSTMTLYNINGQLILSTHLQHSTHTIDLGYLQKGVYILQLGHQMYKFVCQ